MPIWLVTFLTNLLKPVIEQVASAIAALVKEKMKETEEARIEKARVDGNAAKTDEERIKAAREAQDANRHL